MASTNKTNHLALNQWAAEDPVLREDFNSDNTKIDTALASMSTQLAGLAGQLASIGNCRIGTGSYVGTGTVGINNKNMLIFDRKPAYILIYESLTGGIMHIIGQAAGEVNNYFRHYDSSFGRNRTSWNGSTVNWYCDYGGGALSSSANVSAVQQANESGKTYYYIYLEVCA